MIKEYMLSPDFIDGMNYDMFISGLTTNITEDKRAERAESLYKLIKCNEDEGISAEEIGKLVQDCSESMSFAEIQNMIKSLSNNEQKITKADFIKYMCEDTSKK